LSKFPYTIPEGGIELVEKRDKFRKVFKLPNGNESILTTLVPIHYPDVNNPNQWLEADTQIFQNTSPESTYLYSTRNHSFHLHFNHLCENRAIKFSYENGSLGRVYLTVQGIALYDQSIKQSQLFLPFDNCTISIINNDNSIIYDTQFVSIQYDSNLEGIKETITLKDGFKNLIPDILESGLNPDTTYVVVKSLFEYDNVELTQSDDGILEFYSGGDKVFFVTNVTATSANNKNIKNPLGQYEDNIYYHGISYKASQYHMYPIIIDPSISVAPNSLTINGSYTTTDDKGNSTTTPSTTKDITLNWSEFPFNAISINSGGILNFTQDILSNISAKPCYDTSLIYSGQNSINIPYEVINTLKSRYDQSTTSYFTLSTNYSGDINLSNI
jgi:hypothetical protein